MLLYASMLVYLLACTVSESHTTRIDQPNKQDNEQVTKMVSTLKAVVRTVTSCSLCSYSC